MQDIMKLFLGLNKADQWDCVGMLVKLSGWTAAPTQVSGDAVKELRAAFAALLPVNTNNMSEKDKELFDAADSILAEGDEGITSRQAGLVKAALRRFKL